jgi:hypothetical protein
VNEDERGITPPGVTAITVEHREGGTCSVTVEQGNGAVLKNIELTRMERMMLAGLLQHDSGPLHAEFVDVTR